jgi:hypothetical protein
VVEAYSARFPTLPQIFWASTSAACLSEAKLDEVRTFTLWPLNSTVAGGVHADKVTPKAAIIAILLYGIMELSNWLFRLPEV